MGVPGQRAAEEGPSGPRGLGGLLPPLHQPLLPAPAGRAAAAGDPESSSGATLSQVSLRPPGFVSTETRPSVAQGRKTRQPFPLPVSGRIKILDVFSEQTLESVFGRLVEPPASESLNAAKQRLRDLGALTVEEKLTPLGYHLACLPVDVRIGKLMLLGAIFRCLDPVLTIAASLAFKSPFVRNVSPHSWTNTRPRSSELPCPASVSRCLRGTSGKKPTRRSWPSPWPTATTLPCRRRTRCRRHSNAR